MKIQKTKIGVGEGGGGVGFWGGQGGCDRRIEKFLGKFKKKKNWGGGSGGGGVRGGWGGSGWMRTKN